MATVISGLNGVSKIEDGAITAEDFEAALFEASKTANGYSYLPNGLIVQWGITASIAANTNTTVNFPITFPNACLRVVPTAENNADPVVVGVMVKTFTASNVTLRNADNDNVYPIAYIAIGH